MSKKIKIGAVGMLLISLSPLAHAEWLTKVDDDIFTGGHTAMLLGTDSGDNGIILDCTKDSLLLSYVEHGDTKNVTEGLPVDLLLKVGDAKPLKFAASTGVRNNDTFALKANDADLIRSFLAQLRVSNGKILVGIHYPQNDAKITSTFTSTGSTAAVGKFIKACEINLPADTTSKS